LWFFVILNGEETQSIDESHLMKGKDSRITNANSNPSPPRALSRRKFMLTGGAAAGAFAIVPRHVLGGPGFVAPS